VTETCGWEVQRAILPIKEHIRVHESSLLMTFSVSESAKNLHYMNSIPPSPPVLKISLAYVSSEDSNVLHSHYNAIQVYL